MLCVDGAIERKKNYKISLLIIYTKGNIGHCIKTLNRAPIINKFPVGSSLFLVPLLQKINSYVQYFQVTLGS